MNSFRANRERRLDLPTAESPIITILNKYFSSVSSSEFIFLACFLAMGGFFFSLWDCLGGGKMNGIGFNVKVNRGGKKEETKVAETNGGPGSVMGS